jgi:hypothetical protein
MNEVYNECGQQFDSHNALIRHFKKTVHNNDDENDKEDYFNYPNHSYGI